MKNTTILNGKQCADFHLAQLKKQISKKNIALAVIQVGSLAASTLYIKKKLSACLDAGIKTHNYNFDNNTSELELINKIKALNQDEAINGILVQLPLPAHINTQTIAETISKNKDVDGFNPYNLGLLAQKQPTLKPCTPYGIKLLLDYYKIDLTGLHAVIVGASNLVGLPTALSCLTAKATVTICHSHTKNLSAHIKQADCLISAIGKTNIIDANNIKPGAIVIDVGINYSTSNKLTGDIDFDIACKYAKYITPVPGGVGPMTVTALLLNTYAAFKMQQAN